MKNNIIFYKLIKKQKAIIPLLLVTAIGMGFLHHLIDKLSIHFFSWSLLVSILIFGLNQKELIRWENKKFIKKVQEVSLFLLGSYFVLLLPITVFVAICLFLLQIYLVTILTETGDEVTPFVKSKVFANKLSPDEREGFITQQKMNYPEPDSEMEIAIIQNELKIQEILRLKDELEKNILGKESEIKQMQKDIENSQDFQYTKSLQETIEQKEHEKEKLIDKRLKLIQEKQSLEELLRIQQIKFEQQQKRTENLIKEQNQLKESLMEQGQLLEEQQRQKQYLESEKLHLTKVLEQRYKEINQLNTEREKLETIEIESQKRIDEISNKLEVTKQKQKKYEEQLLEVQQINLQLKSNYQKEKQDTELKLNQLLEQKNNVDQHYNATLEQLNAIEKENKDYHNEKNKLENEILSLQEKLEKLSVDQQNELSSKQSHLNELKFQIREKENKVYQYKLKLSEILEGNQKITRESEEFKRKKKEDLLRLGKEIKNRDNLEDSLKKELITYKESNVNLEKDKDALQKEIQTLYNQINIKTNEVNSYQNQLNDLEAEKQKYEQVFKDKEQETIKLLTTISQIESKLKLKEIELSATANNLNSIINEKNKLGIALENRVKDIKVYEDLLADNDREYASYNAQLKNKEEQIKQKEQIIIHLQREIQNLQSKKQIAVVNFEDLKSKGSYKVEILERFNVLYPNLSFSKYFLNHLKSLNKKEQLEVEKQLLFLNYDFEKNVNYRPHSVIVNNGPAVREIVYKQEDKRRVGEGRIYVRGKQIIALSSDHKEQKRVIQKIKSGELELIS